MHWAWVILYCHLWPVPLYSIFPHYLINGTIWGGKRYWTQNVFWFSLQLLPETFLILRRNRQDITINVQMSSNKVHVFVVQIDSEEIPTYQNTWKSVQWEPSRYMRMYVRTDTHKQGGQQSRLAILLMAPKTTVTLILTIKIAHSVSEKYSSSVSSI